MPRIRDPSARDDHSLLSYESWPFYWLARAHGRYQDALTAAFAGTDMDAPTWRIIMTLKQTDWMTVSEIAAQANAKLSTMTKALQRMEAAGLVESRCSVQDRRATEVCLTKAGQAQVEGAVETAQHIFRRAFADFGPKQLADLRSMLLRVADNLR